jgi:hypothetical protein
LCLAEIDVMLAASFRRVAEIDAMTRRPVAVLVTRAKVTGDEEACS